MTVDVTLPELGLGVGATLSTWHVREGESVEAGERLVEVVIPGATVDVAAPASGRLSRRLVGVGGVVGPGVVLGRIEAG